MNPLPDCSNYSPFCHTHYLTLSWTNTSLVLRPDPLPKPLRWRQILILHCCSALLQNLVGNSCRQGSTVVLNNKQRQVVMILLLLFKLSSHLPFISFSLSLSSLCSFSSSSFPLASPASQLSLMINSLSS